MIKPLRNNIIVKLSEVSNTTESGIILTESAVEKPTYGEVIACGPGLLENGKRIPLDMKVGDTVMFTQFAGKDLVVDGEPVVMMLDQDVFAIV
jgi:chaperonin GroES